MAYSGAYSGIEQYKPLRAADIENALNKMEKVQYKLASLDGLSSGDPRINDYYPSARLMYDILTTKEKTANKTAVISGASTDDQYPSTRALYNTIRDIKNATRVRAFGCVKTVQTFTAPVSGTYALQVFGGGGGNDDGPGGFGGYAHGFIYLAAGTILYICVGGAGTSNTSGGYGSGGYNGGGDAGPSAYSGGGGGATHIATVNKGVLANYANYKGNVLIVAGGGGGGGNNKSAGGHGGGINNTPNGSAGGGASGGTQTAGGTGGGTGNSKSGWAGSFGQGAHHSSGDGGGGGGGWYGGGASAYDRGGGGGSSYINTARLSNPIFDVGTSSASAGQAIITIPGV
ncbi:MAG: hypothetical protein LBD99_04835 [Candidatus Margulisbacteria bacterium]|jgi:hypothetical protein|nr:hypothetical protein [Candidatus Margulisiibacteriota bacterium]